MPANTNYHIKFALGPHTTDMTKVNDKKRDASALEENDSVEKMKVLQKEMQQREMLRLLHLQTEVDRMAEELKISRKSLKAQKAIVGKSMNLDNGPEAMLEDEHGNQLALLKAEYTLKMYSAVGSGTNDGEEEENGE
jgi:hypothetical protein